MDQEIIDYDKALQRIGGDPGFLLELLDDLIDQLDDNLEVLRDAIVCSNYEDIKTLSHNLKGVSANLNVNSLSAHFLKLEQLGAQGRSDGALDLLNLVSKDTCALKQFIDNHRS